MAGPRQPKLARLAPVQAPHKQERPTEAAREAAPEQRARPRMTPVVPRETPANPPRPGLGRWKKSPWRSKVGPKAPRRADPPPLNPAYRTGFWTRSSMTTPGSLLSPWLWTLRLHRFDLTVKGWQPTMQARLMAARSGQVGERGGAR
jgi:hypothetical protein